MKKNLLLTLFIALLGIQAQTTVSIGTGTSVGDAPYSLGVDYNYTQSLYLSSEINNSGFITEIQWTLNTAGPIDNNDELTVFMVETTRTEFDGSTSTAGAPFDFLTQVFSGTVTLDASNNVKVILDTPFYYTGKNNLIIAVNETSMGTNSIGGPFFFNATNTSTPRTILRGQPNSTGVIDPSSTAFLGKENEFANIEITIDNSCSSLSIPYTEDFNTTNEITSGQPYRTIPDCWTTIASINDFASVTSNSGFTNIFGMTNGSGSSDLTLISPEITNLSNGNAKVTLRFGGSAGGEQVIVGTLSDPNNAASFSAIQTLTASSSISNPNVGLAEFEINIPLGSNNYLAFRHGNASGTSPNIFLDDISITEIPLSTIETKNNKEELSIYPNPVENVLNFKVNKEIKSIKVYNRAGKILMNTLTNNNSLEIGHLNSGIYFLQIEAKDGSFFTKKFLKK